MKITEQDLIWTMVSKTIKFDYTGGTYTQNFNIRGTNLPWTYECDSTWIGLTPSASSITIDVRNIYTFETRTGVVKVFDKFRNEIDLIVEQSGYYDLSVEAPETVVLYQNYYDEHQTYDIYATVYGGSTQGLVCRKLGKYTQKLWDNSNMYNDYIIRIPQTLKGNFVLKHSDCESFKKFCKETGMEYPKEKLERHLSIVQVTNEDVVGEMVIKCNDNTYTNHTDDIEIDVSYNKPTVIDVVSTTFMQVLSMTSYSIINNSDVIVPITPIWVDATVSEKKIILKCNEINRFIDRYGMIKIENTDNPRQSITIKIKQKSGN